MTDRSEDIEQAQSPSVHETTENPKCKQEKEALQLLKIYKDKPEQLISLLRSYSWRTM